MNEKTSKDLGYETEDASTSKLLWSGVTLAVLVIVAVAAMTVMFGVLYDARDEAINEVGPMVDLEAKPQGPILRVDPPRELIEMRAQSRSDGSTYGWVNKESGTVRIPVERAMKLLVGRGIQ